MKGGLGQLMKQAQQMQANLEKAQEELAQLEISGEAGGGMVKVLMTGKHQVKQVSIEPALIGEDKDMLEDLIAAAFNDAAARVDRMVKEKMSGLAGGLPLPPGMTLPL
jgi:DNA-binding YbaB/EbfC family protein